jgi:segregation and condensation protein B
MPSPDAPDPDLLDLGRAAAVRFGEGDWQHEAEPAASAGGELSDAAVAPRREAHPSRSPRQPETPPPDPDRIVESLLFVGGPPLTPEAIGAAVRGMTPDGARVAIDRLNRAYRSQNRPYSIQPRDGGYVLTVKPAYRGIRERLVGGPREARLTQPALDVLSLVAYRQPITRAEIDALRGADSGSVLRHLVRLGLVAVTSRAEAAGREAGYGTTPRFLELFGLASLDDLPRLADTAL